MLTTAREEARAARQVASALLPEAQDSATSITGLRALVVELECKLAVATEAQLNWENYKLQEKGAELLVEQKEKPGAMLARAREEARVAREEARVAREVARASSEAKVAAVGSSTKLRALVAELECKLEAARGSELGRENLALQARVAELLTESVAKPAAAAGGLIFREHMTVLTNEAEAALKIQAAARGWRGRTDYRLVRDSEACRQWVAFHVARGEDEEAEQLGWDGEHPSPLTEQELKANVAAYVRNTRIGRDSGPSSPTRDSAPPATRRPPRYRRTQSINTAVRASSNACARCHSPEYRQDPTPDWVRAAASPANKSRGDALVLSSGHPHHDMIELVRDVEACRQWVAFHVARGEYKDAVELGWDGANPPPPTEQELGLLEADYSEYLKDEAPSSPRDVSIEVFARSPVRFASHVSPAALRPRPLLPREECIEVAAANPHLQVMIEVAAYASAPSALSRSTGAMRPQPPVHLTILERQASFLSAARANEQPSNSANIEASVRVEERLQRARNHNKQVARMAAASTALTRHARGHLTRAQLRREAERRVKLQRENREGAFARTQSLTRGRVQREGARAPSGRRAVSVCG